MIKTIMICIVMICYSQRTLAQHYNNVIKINSDIELISLKDSIFIHKNWFEFGQSGRFSSNGLIFIKNGNAILVNTPCNNEQTAQLYSYLRDSMNVMIQKLIVCHFHIDCLGGIEFIQEQGIESIGLDLTKKICIEKDLAYPSTTFQDKLEFAFEGEKLICQYFGPGHTLDNIVVYFPNDKILYGGCLVKSLSANNLGNTDDAVVDKWGSTIEKLQKTYKNIEFVIPGHGEFGSTDLLKHTISLLGQGK